MLFFKRHRCGLIQTTLHGLASVQASWVVFAVVCVVASCHWERKLEGNLALAPMTPLTCFAELALNVSSGYIWD